MQIGKRLIKKCGFRAEYGFGDTNILAAFLGVALFEFPSGLRIIPSGRVAGILDRLHRFFGAFVIT